MRYIAYIFWAVVLAIAIGFVVLNWQIVTVDYYAGKFDIFLPLLLLLVLVIGALLGVVTMVWPLFRCKRSIRRLSTKVAELEQEIKNLRHIPIKDDH